MDILLFDYDGMVNWSKRRAMKVHFVRVAASLVSFLEANGLTLRKLRDDNMEIPSNLKIMESDLTDEGKVLMRKSYYRWLDAHDRGTQPEDVSILERALKKIRNAKA